MKSSNKFLLLSSILPIIAYNFSPVTFVSFVPMFFLLEEENSIFHPTLYMLPFYLYIYSGIYKSTHTYYGLFFLFSLGIVFLLAIYNLFYVLLPIIILKKTNLPKETFPILFVASEFLKDKLFYGMPLGNLNILTYNLHYFIKDTSLFGSLFIDLKILLINLAIFYLIKKRLFRAFIMLAICIIPIIFTPNTKPKYSKKVTISIVQGNIPQNQKWRDKYLKRNLNIYIDLSNGLKSDYVFWPESAYPYLFEKNYATSIKELIHRNRFALIFGAIRDEGNNYYNSIIFYSRKKIETYNKQKLVPFAEFIPFAKELGLENESLTPGSSNVLFSGKLRIGPMICYEENFENIARIYKKMKAEILAVFTNDAWFDKTPTFYLFPRSDVYRALENRIWLIRVANTGISFILNSKGQIVRELKPDKRAVLTSSLTIKIYPQTFYDKYGWMFGWIMILFSILLLFYKISKPQTV